MTADKDIAVLLKWACLNRPGGHVAYVDNAPDASASPSTLSTPFVTHLPSQWLLEPDLKQASPWRGLYLRTTAATLYSYPSLPSVLLSVITGPVVIRVTLGAPGLRETCDMHFVQSGWLRHPLIFTAIDYTALESEETSVLLAYLAPEKSSLRAHPLAALAEERNLHMDMLREAGRRSDAHLARYTWSFDFIRPNDQVVDAASGLGYGYAMLRAGTSCGTVRGMDISEPAVAYARAMYGTAWKGLEYQVCDLSDLSSVPDNSVDCFVSFETFEHLADPHAFAKQILRVLKPGGRLLCSVPNRWVDETGKDPSPYHLHTFDLPLLLKVCEGFLVEMLVGQCAGGTDPRFSATRRFEIFECIPDHNDERTKGVEWWLLAAMKDPIKPGEAKYCETVFPALQLHPATAPYANGYANPWIVHPLVHIPFRLKTAHSLTTSARQLAATTKPGSADHGAALSVLAYQALGLANSNSAKTECRQLALAIHTHLAVKPQAPHEHRWHISLSFVLGQIAIALEEPVQARIEFECCAQLDFRQFAPHIATKTTEAAFQAGRLALYEGDFVSAKRCFERGLTIGRQLHRTPLDLILLDPHQPHLHGLGDGMREYVLALDNVSRCANGLTIIKQYEIIGRADISAIDRSWQWEVRHLSEELRISMVDSSNRLNQIQELTHGVQQAAKDDSLLRDQITQLTALAKKHEAESADRNRQIKTLTAELNKVQSDATSRLAQVKHLTKLAADSQAAAATQEQQVIALTALAKKHETESADRDRQVKTLTAELKKVHGDATARLTQIEQLTKLVHESQAAATEQRQQVVTLSALLQSHEAESLARLEQVHQLTAHLKSCSADNLALRGQVESFAGWLKDAQRDMQLISTAHRDAEKTVHALLKQLESGEKPPSSA